MANTTIHTTAAHTVTASRNVSASTTSRARRAFGSTNTRLWVAQGALAALFLFAGASKLVMPAEELTKNSEFSIEFMRFIGVCETLGAIGLVLPALLRIRTSLTPLAAACLTVIMFGATVATLDSADPALAVMPAVVGAVLAWVAIRRSTTNVHRGRTATAVS